jgi:hypothetical protein
MGEVITMIGLDIAAAEWAPSTASKREYPSASQMSASADIGPRKRDASNAMRHAAAP